jgi:hypothetical protein
MTLEQQLRASIQLLSMRQAIELALPLLKKEFDSIKHLPFITFDCFLAGEYLREAEQWREAMEACQKALQPVQAETEVDEPIRLVQR